MKVQKSAQQYTDAAKDEITILRQTGKHPRIVEMVSDFPHFADSGRHICMVFELLGKNLLWLIEQYGRSGIPIQDCKVISRDLLEAIEYLASVSIIHTDIKPENIFLCPGNDLHVKLGDLGNGCWVDKHFTEDITTRQYRSPEAILEAGYGLPTDTFSVACTIFEAITSDYLFEPKEPSKWDDYSRNEDHLALIQELSGSPVPQSMIERSSSRAKKWFNQSGQLRNIHDFEYWSLFEVLTQKYKLPIDEANELSSFLLPMLRWEPDTRDHPSELLSHSWVTSKTTVHNVGKCRQVVKERVSDKFDSFPHEEKNNSSFDLLNVSLVVDDQSFVRILINFL
jgi:serine/threonine protein kinase